MQAHQMGAIVRQLAAAQGLFQALFQTVELYWGVPGKPQALEEVLHQPQTVARHDLHQVAGQPAAGAGRLQFQEVDPRAAALGVEQGALAQGPVGEGRGLPQVHRGMAGELAQLLLPVAQGVGVATVDLHRGEQAATALARQPGVQAPGEPAELRVLAIAQAQHRVLQAVEGQLAAQQLALEAPGAVRRLTVTEGTDHEQRPLSAAQVLLAQAGQRADPGTDACGLQLPGGLPGQLLGETALAGKADQPAVGVVGRLFQTLAGILDLAFLAPAIQVQQPAGDEEQRHAQRGQGQHDASHQAEVAAHVQGVDTGQQLRLEALVGVAIVPADDAGGRVQGDLVQGALVGRILEQVEHRRRLPGHGRHAHVVGAQILAGGAVDAAPHGSVVGHRGRALGRWAAATATDALALRCIREQAGQALAVPLVRPVQAGQGERQVEQQAPGTEHRVQVPVEGPAFLGPVQGQPGAPAGDLARPAQVQAGQAEENQDQGAGPGDLPAAVAHGQEPVQLQHEAEEALAQGLAGEFTGIGIEVAHLPTAFAGRWCEEHPRGVAAVGLDPEHGHVLALASLELGHQFGGRQRAGGQLVDLQHRWVEGAQDLVLERHHGPGDPHQGQDQPGADAEEPVQLEQGFLQHIDRLDDPER